MGFVSYFLALMSLLMCFARFIQVFQREADPRPHHQPVLKAFLHTGIAPSPNALCFPCPLLGKDDTLKNGSWPPGSRHLNGKADP